MRILIFCTLFSTIFFAGCEKDNFKAPKSILSGQIEYEGTPIGLKSNEVQLELWQHGFELFSKIPVYVDENGKFSAALFNGDYKLTMIPGNGPWVPNSDSIDVNVSGNTIINFPVVPYFMISNVDYTVSGNNVDASFSINQIDESRNLGSVVLIFGKTRITDVINNVKSTSLPASEIDISAPIKISSSIPENILNAGDSIYVRLGVKVNGVAEYLYSVSEGFKM